MTQTQRWIARLIVKGWSKRSIILKLTACSDLNPNDIRKEITIVRNMIREANPNIDI